MRKRELTIAIVFLSVILLSAGDAFRYGHSLDGSRKSAGPPACHAGEPPNNTTCQTSGCHSSFPLNSGAAELELYLGGAELGYIPGAEYTIRISVSKPSLMRGGFQLIALQDNDATTSPGTFTLTSNREQLIDAAHPHVQPGCDIENKVWVEHTEDGIDDVFGDSISWQFDWRAPTSDVGSITFYVAAVEADVDFDATGDYVYSTSQTVNLSTTGLEDAGNEETMMVYPNPTSDLLYFKFAATANRSQDNAVVIYSLSGKVVLETALSHAISVKNLPIGRYVATTEFDGRKRFFQFVKL